MDLSKHTSLAGLAEAIAAVQAAASLIGCDIYVTGGLARDLWLEFGHGIDTGRKTEDVDFGIECADWRTFDKKVPGTPFRYSCPCWPLMPPTDRYLAVRSRLSLPVT